MKKFFFLFIVLLFCTYLKAQITSAVSGNWSSNSTWTGGVVPTFTNDVVIDSGDIVIVDIESSCKSISFADTNARLGLNANLNCYGDFNRFNNSVNPFYSGSTLWTPGAKFIFKGDAATQTITNLGTTSTSPYPLRFDELVIDKSAGKFVTSAAGLDYKLGIGTSLEILNGTFEVDSVDDIEGRNTSGIATTPTISVSAGGIFNMRGGASHIRRGNFSSGVTTSKIGKLTVFGTAYLASSSSNRMNFTDIDIESGGVIEFPVSRGTATNTFNAGTITVKNGGSFINRLSSTAFWYTNDTIPVSVIINNGGEYEAAATSTTIPQGGFIQNSGSSFRYSSSNPTTMPSGITSYKTLILSGAGSKTLGVNTTIEEALQLSGSFTTLSLGTYTLTYNAGARLRYGASGQTTAQTTKDAEWPATGGPQNVQIYNSGGVTLHDSKTLLGILTLTLGQFDNNGSADDKVLTLGNGATISRARGSLSSAPMFGSTVNVSYTGTIENVTTGFEIPTSASVLADLDITSSQGITLGNNLTVNDTLIFGSGASSITTGSSTITLGSSAMLIGESSGRYVIGNLSTTRNVGTSSSTFGGIGVSVNAGADNLGNVAITRISGTNGIVAGNGNNSIARKWSIVSDNPPTNGRDLTLSWVSSDDNGKTFSTANKALAYRFYNGSWNVVGLPVDVSLSDPRSVAVNTKSFSDWSVSDQNAPLSLKSLNLSALIEGLYNGTTMVTDTVNIRLHGTSSPYTLLEQKQTILNSSGDASANFILAADGESYYLAVNHRNGLETWSASGQTFSAGTLSYNFMSNSSQAFGNNMIQKGTKWCFYSGDVNQDGVIDLTDVASVDIDNLNFVTGYTVTDVNGDNLVDLADLALVDTNNLNFISKIIP